MQTARTSPTTFKFVVRMDELHPDLKDLILFINQYSKFDLLAVEMEFCRHDDYEIVIPKLFGAETKRMSRSRRRARRG